VLIKIDPVTAGVIGFIIFYLTMFGGVVGFLTTISTIIRAWNHPTRDVEEVVVISLRQATILAFLFTGALALLSQNLLNWFSISALLLVVGLLEAVFILKKKPIKPEV
jgi:hypothetical protein